MFRIVSSSATHFNQGNFSSGNGMIYKNVQCYSKECQRRRGKPTICQSFSRSESPNQVKKITCRGRGSSRLCPPLPEASPPPKAPSTGLGMTIIALILIMGGVIAYAKQNPQFRDDLNEYFPISDEIIKVVFEEEKSYMESIHQYIDSLKGE
nr:uncharacterized protein LOC111428927 [Onthophagus taurus]XP_022920435.1 uncharacterized protein LOC111428927 [Onthophagus taurus]